MGILVTRTSVVSSGFTDGQAVSFTGTGFGTFSGTRRSLKDGIEGATNGTHVINVAALTALGVMDCDANEASTGMHSNISTTGPLFGTKCLEGTWNGDGRFGFSIDHGSTFTRCFYRDYVRIETIGAGGQWKNIRYVGENCLTDDANTNAYWLLRYSGGVESNSNLQVNEGSGCGLGGNVSVNTKGPTLGVARDGTWYEREIEMVFGTQGTADGIGQIRFRRVSDWTLVSSSSEFTNVINFGASNTNRPRWTVIHNYFGNGWETSAGAWRIDAPFWQVGSRQRAYISPQSTWAAVLSTGKRELLDRVTSWSGTSISGTLRQGILSAGDLAGTLYGYVVDDDGANVNSTGAVLQAA